MCRCAVYWPEHIGESREITATAGLAITLMLQEHSSESPAAEAAAAGS